MDQEVWDEVLGAQYGWRIGQERAEEIELQIRHKA